MSVDAVSHSSLCGCDCAFPASASTAPSGWGLCECVLCGGGRCSVPVSPLLRFAALHDRGLQPKKLADIAASPNYCGDCRDHNLLQIRIAAVRRAREKRQNEQADSVTQALIQRGASRSRSPKHSEGTQEVVSSEEKRAQIEKELQDAVMQLYYGLRP